MKLHVAWKGSIHNDCTHIDFGNERKSFTYGNARKLNVAFQMHHVFLYRPKGPTNEVSESHIQNKQTKFSLLKIVVRWENTKGKYHVSSPCSYISLPALLEIGCCSRYMLILNQPTFSLYAGRNNFFLSFFHKRSKESQRNVAASRFKKR